MRISSGGSTFTARRSQPTAPVDILFRLQPHSGLDEGKSTAVPAPSARRVRRFSPWWKEAEPAGIKVAKFATQRVATKDGFVRGEDWVALLKERRR